MMQANNLQYQHPDDAGKCRVVETDNFDGDYPDEKFAGPVMSKEHAEQVAEIFNSSVPSLFERYWKVVTAPYKLRPGFEP